METEYALELIASQQADYTESNCDSLEDFENKAWVGEKWTDNQGVTYYKAQDSSGEAICVKQENEQWIEC